MRTRPRWDLSDTPTDEVCCSLRNLAFSCRSRGAKAPHLPALNGDKIPHEVWAKVFEYLRPNSEDAVDNAQTQNVAKVMTDQACFHQLKLVCSKFRDVFAEHPELSNAVNISQPSSDASTFVVSMCCGFSSGAAPFAVSMLFLGSSITN